MSWIYVLICDIKFYATDLCRNNDLCRDFVIYVAISRHKSFMQHPPGLLVQWFGEIWILSHTKILFPGSALCKYTPVCPLPMTKWYSWSFQLGCVFRDFLQKIADTARTVLSASSEIRVCFALRFSALYKIRGVFYTKLSVEKIIGVLGSHINEYSHERKYPFI